MTFERGDLLLVPFPFTDLSAAKRRPVLAVTMRWGRDDREFSSRAPDAAQHECRELGVFLSLHGVVFAFFVLGPAGRPRRDLSGHPCTRPKQKQPGLSTRPSKTLNR